MGKHRRTNRVYQASLHDGQEIVLRGGPELKRGTYIDLADNSYKIIEVKRVEGDTHRILLQHLGPSK